MNRRQFLATLGIGAPAAVLAAKAGLLERARTYFFAPKQGWIYDDLRLYGGARGRGKMVMITNPGGVGHAWVHRALEQQYMRPLTVAMDRDSHLFDTMPELIAQARVTTALLRDIPARTSFLP